MKSDCILIQQASGKSEELLRLTEPIHRAYCERHGIDYRVLYSLCDTSRHPFWQKVTLLRQACAEDYRRVIWLDADTLIITDEDLRNGCPHIGIGACWHAKDWGEHAGLCYNHFNGGALYISNSQQVRDFLWDWWSTPDDHHPWRDTHALNKLENSLIHNTIFEIDAKWNSTYPDSMSENPVVMAWHGYGTHDVRLAAMQKAVKQYYPEHVPHYHPPIDFPYTVGSATVAAEPVLSPPIQNVDTLYHKAYELKEAGEYEGAEHLYRQAIALSPMEPEILRQYGQMLAQCRRFEEAKGVLEQAIAYEPYHAGARVTYGAILAQLGDNEGAGREVMEAMMLAPEMHAAYWNYSLWLLLNGNYRDGWDAYEWGKVYRSRRIRTLAPEAELITEQDKTLFVWAEQGRGDTLMFVRFLPMVKKLFPHLKIILEVQPDLVPILTRQGLADIVFAQTVDGSIPYAYDKHIALTSLPKALGINQPADIPGDAYLCADQRRFAEVAEVFGPRDDTLRVGLCEHGSKTHAHDPARSLSEGSFAREWGAIEGMTACFLHAGETVAPGVTLNDWQTTAAVIANLDLVITVDTAVAHLAGAMGKPAWILLPLYPDWRWMLDREDSPWYPTVRLFRQTERDNWTDVLQRVRASLETTLSI